jgi:FMN phosphatase YigB (HAD superfamily)
MEPASKDAGSFVNSPISMNLTIIDFNRTIYNPETKDLMDGARELLEALSASMPVVLVSKLEEGRSDLLDTLRIRDFFADVYFTPEKTLHMFCSIMRAYNASPHQTLVIGDHPHREIAIGIEIGAQTVHLKQGRFASLSYPKGEPWRVVSHLSEIRALLGS